MAQYLMEVVAILLLRLLNLVCHLREFSKLHHVYVRVTIG